MSAEPRIAIVGLGGLFPGAANLEQFWQNVVAGRDASRDVPRGRWLLDPEAAITKGGPFPDRVPHSRGYYLDEIPIDCSTLDIDEAWLRQLDPIFHLVLHVGQQTLGSAKMQPVDRQRIGVILGHIALPTEKVSALAIDYLGRRLLTKLGLDSGLAPQVNPLNRYVAGLPAGLLAKALGLGGTTYTLDAACASSLYALKLAADELRAGRADAMLTGGAARPDCLYTQMGFAQLRALSPTGKCSPFDAAADGLVVGEGCGMFVLKRLDDAIGHGDTILAVLAGEGLSNDVEGNLLAPASEGQLRAMRAAYAAAGWTPSDVDLVECHATGTPVGDAVEFESLRSLWQDEPWRTGQCVIGSVKSCVGHLLTAAGAAALAKMLIALRREVLPPTTNFRQPARSLNMDASPFRVLSQAEPWRKRNAETPRRAAISGFGFGGINAHVLLEEFREPITKSADESRPIVISRDEIAIAVVGMNARVGRWQSFADLQKKMFKAVSSTDETARNATANAIDVPLDQFRIPPKELEEMLPQQLLSLQTAAAALADCRGWEKYRERTGVFLGVGLDLNTTNFHFRWWLSKVADEWRRQQSGVIDDSELDAWLRNVRDSCHPALNANRTMGALASIAASRIARAFQFAGPSFTICTEEGSSGAALEAAVRRLQRGDIDQAVVGGTELAGDERARAAAQSLGHRGTPADGAAAVVLKRLTDAERDGDRIYGIIRHVESSSAPKAGTNNDRPGRRLRRAMERLAWRPESLGLLESTTADLPQTEWDSAAGEPAFGCIAESIGDTGAAAFLVAFVRALLALHHDLLPASSILSERTPNNWRAIDEPKFWLTNRNVGPRRAAVLGFGMAGASTLAMLEEHEATKTREDIQRPHPLGTLEESVFPIAAESVFELSEELDRLDAFGHDSTAPIAAVAAGWWKTIRPASNGLRIAFVASSIRQLGRQSAGMRRHLAANPEQPLHDEREGIYYTPQPLAGSGGIAFVFPGSGNHFPGMGRALAARWPAVLRRQQMESMRLRDQFAPDRFWSGRPLDDIDPRFAMFGQVTLAGLICDLLGLFDIKPDASIGYSLGESAALFGLRAWRDRDGMLAQVEDSTLFSSDLAPPYDAARTFWNLRDGEPANWVTAVLAAPPEAIQAALSASDRAYLLIVNSPDECVVGGDRDAIHRLAKKLGTLPIPVSAVTIAHCPVVMPVAAAYRNLHRLPVDAPQHVRFYSGAWGRDYEVNSDTAADAILAHALDTVNFPRLIHRAWKDGIRIFVEIGPGNSCTRLINRILAGKQYRALAVCIPGVDETAHFLHVLAQLWSEGVALSLAPHFEDARKEPAPEGRVVTIPVRGIGTEWPDPPAVRPIIKTVDAAVQAIPVGDSSIHSLASVRAATAEAHADFLSFAQQGSEHLARLMSLHNAWLPAALAMADREVEPTVVVQVPASQTVRPLFDRDLCQEIATGSIARVLGPAFAPVDQFPTRVRFPDGPLLLVDRIVEIEGEPRSLTRGRIVTEHDVTEGRWYLGEGHIPTSIAIEAGQADLFLSGYLGIDFITKGLAVYRLLDAAVTFHRSLPEPGATIRYDIRIERFFRQGDTHLFRFRFDGFVDGEPLLTMTNGCAGFFTAAELAAGRGVVQTELDRRPMSGRKPADWRPLAPMHGVESYSAEQLSSLRDGDLVACFGPEFQALSVSSPLTLPGGMLKLVDRVVELDPGGGRYGLGRIRAELDIHPNDWFLTCHFVDDPVMPGTLMYECCLHTLRIFLLRIGWIGQRGQVRIEPVPGVASQLKCRGQVTGATRTVMYEVSIKEIGYRPEPYVIADALMYADGKPVVDITNMCLRMTGASQQEIASLWNGIGEKAALRRSAIFDRSSILEFASGKPSRAFGARYEEFDYDRFIARLPAPPFSFIDRIVEIRNCEQWKMAAGGEIIAEYDVPADAWYFAANRQATMPFAVLLEAALQPCGWLAAYLGSALTSKNDLHFRNLGGRATQFDAVTPETGTLATKVKITKVSSSLGMIIQNYEFLVTCRGRTIYQGDTYFGFFSEAALSEQVGIREAALHQPTAQEVVAARSFAYPSEAPFPDDMLRMIDDVEIFLPAGGKASLGLIRGAKKVKPDEWFFQAHFFRDPVWPGSLGLEAFLQLLKVVAIEHWGAGSATAIQTIGLGVPHAWSYRGQVVPTNDKVTVEAVVTQVDDGRKTIRADGYLGVDGKVIYEMTGFTLQG